MKNKLTALKICAIATVLISSFIACDKDFADIDSDIINNDNATHFNTNSLRFNVVAYNKKLDPVQTNNLPVNLLGVYKDPLYGTTTASVVTQISKETTERVFGDNLVMDSVVLTIPYFSSAVSTTDDGETIYKLDSVYGSSPIKLSIYENKYFLRDYDPNSDIDSPQKYYSNGSTGADQINASLLEGTLIKDTIGFVPSEKEIKLVDTTKTLTERVAPSLRIKLDPDFWYHKIIEKEGEPELSNANNFENYFRGIYFKAEAIGADGNMALLNFASQNANITMYYTIDSATQENLREGQTYVFTFSSNRVNFISEPSFVIPDGNETAGDEKLYLKGGQGSLAVIDLFDGVIQDPDTGLDVPQLDYFKSKKGKWLINEANLVFYVDQSSVEGLNEPDRIYLYDLENGTPLVDYSLDIDNTASPINSKTTHLGRLERVDDEPDGLGIKYRMKITEHVKNILLNDSTNVKLGLAVSANVNLEGTYSQRAVLTSDEVVNKVPISSILTQKGTVLFGNNTSEEGKKVSLEIFYTEPHNN